MADTGSGSVRTGHAIPHLAVSLQQYRVEEALCQVLEADYGTRIRWQTSVKDIVPSPEGVMLKVEGPAGAKEAYELNAS